MQITTTRLVRETVRLVEAAAPAFHRAAIAALIIVVVSIAIGYSPRPAATSLSPIVIVATPTPTGASAASAVRAFSRMAAHSVRPPESAADGAALVVEYRPQIEPAPTATAEPVGGYTAHTDQGDIVVPDDATPVPTDAVYTGPFLAPATTPELPAGQRYCTGFGDWRDFDPNYQYSPVCHR